MSRWKRNTRKEQLESCSGTPLGMEVSLSVLRGRLMEMTKGVPRWTGVKGSIFKGDILAAVMRVVMHSGAPKQRKLTFPEGKN